MTVDHRDFEAMHEQPGGAYAEALRQIRQRDALLTERDKEIAALEENISDLRATLGAIENDTDDDHLRNYIRTVLDA